jgi:hypothetical protein
MSRTDKDRPYVVRLRDDTDGSFIDHDHRNGECIVESESARWLELRRRRHNCNKRLVGTWFCSKKNPVGRRYVWDPSDRGCWARWRSVDGFWLSTQCDGHYISSYFPEIPCKCDDWPPMPTCYPTMTRANKQRWYRTGGVPKWFRDSTWQNPERVRERDELKKATALYNGGGWDDEDDFDFDFPNYGHRHRSAWWYW